MHTHLINCPRCKINFHCGKEKIETCFCKTLHLSKDILKSLADSYNSCLCANCLGENTQSASLKTPLVLFFLLMTSIVFGQFPGPVGSIGTTAIHKDSSVFIGWAKTCTVVRGYQNITNITSGFTDVGLPEYGIGKAGENPIVSLGDGGYAILTFSQTIKNGPGFDFAIFENAFNNKFLELAFVEVSSDGINYFRFPAICNYTTATQIGAFDTLGDASKINNLAGKYRVNYGTPFDLEELNNLSGLNINAITHVKIIDVIGKLTPPYSSLDKNNNPINDPFPTEFGNGGFDLDAVGVIHQTDVGIKENMVNAIVLLYPNPADNDLNISGLTENTTYQIIDCKGQIISSGVIHIINMRIDLGKIPSGLYTLCLPEIGLVYPKFMIKKSEY